MLIEAADILHSSDFVLFDCRFSLTDPRQGRVQYEQGHIPGAFHLDLEQDLSAVAGRHGGRHPLPEPRRFAATLAQYGVGPQTCVIAYDASRLAFAARLWWMMRALGYRPPRLLNGGYSAFLAAGGQPERDVPEVTPCSSASVSGYRGYCDIEGLRAAMADGAMLVDSRESRRYQGLEEPIDPVAGHIPGAVNRPWQGVTDSDGWVLDRAGQETHWGEVATSQALVVYCGSGVTACVNLFSLALLGEEDATLYAGGWSDWCSHL